MSRVTELRQAATFAYGLYRERAAAWYHGYLRGDLNTKLYLPAGRRDPYAVYDVMRAGPPMQRTRMDNWVTPSYRICHQVMRDRRMGVRPEPYDDSQDQVDLSFLERNPPDHTRLRRIAAPAFSKKHMTTYRPRVEAAVHALIDDVERRPAAADDGVVDLVPTCYVTTTRWCRPPSRRPCASTPRSSAPGGWRCTTWRSGIRSSARTSSSSP